MSLLTSQQHVAVCKSGPMAHPVGPTLGHMPYGGMHLSVYATEIVNWADRVAGKWGLYNHSAHLDDCFTHIWDGYPVSVWAPREWNKEKGIGARWLNSGKYNCCVFKGHLAITFWGGIVGYSGLHLGVDHDFRILQDTEDKFPILPGEWRLGDLAYQHALRCLAGRTRPNARQHNLPAWTPVDDFLKEFIAFYRARVESVIHRVKNHGWCKTEFRGSFEMLNTLNNIAVLVTALEIRLDFELDDKFMFECVGPWPHTFYP